MVQTPKLFPTEPRSRNIYLFIYDLLFIYSITCDQDAYNQAMFHAKLQIYISYMAQHTFFGWNKNLRFWFGCSVLH